jgi:adenylate cyclase
VEAVGRENAAKLSPSALKAHDLVLRAKAHALKYTRNDLEQARQMARYAIELDPTSAQAPACYAFCCSVIIYSNWTSDRDQLRVEAFDAAKRAVALDATDNYARWVLGMVYLTRREYEEARIHLEKVVENNPNDTEGRGIFAMLLVAVGEAGAAIEHFEIMKRQNPFDLSWFPWIKGLAYFTLRRYGMAIATFKGCLNPTMRSVDIWRHAMLTLASPRRLRRCWKNSCAWPNATCWFSRAIDSRIGTTIGGIHAGINGKKITTI